MQSKTLKNKVAIVTGAGRGIGRAIALAYAAEGAKVVVASRTASTVDDVVGEIKRAGGEALGLTLDVGDKASVNAMVEKAVAAFGAVHILVNNAQGFHNGKKQHITQLPVPFEETDDEQWEYTFRTGASATLWAMKAAFPHMKSASHGRIINFGSSAGQIGTPGYASYNATKEAIRALTRTAAREWGQHGITVNVINPMIETRALENWKREMPDSVAAINASVPMRRIGDPLSDLAPLAVFLAGDGAGYLTGMTYMVEGGLYLFA